MATSSRPSTSSVRPESAATSSSSSATRPSRFSRSSSSSAMRSGSFAAESRLSPTDPAAFSRASRAALKRFCAKSSRLMRASSLNFPKTLGAHGKSGQPIRVSDMFVTLDGGANRSLRPPTTHAGNPQMTPPDQAPPEQHKVRRLANAIRALSMDAVEAAKSGHPGLPMGMADVATVLFSRFLKFSAAEPGWADRDRFVLSAGHGSMLLYSLLWLTGYPKITIDDLKHFRKVGSPTAGHPEHGDLPGIETTTGPLGQGIGNAVGMALAERILNARFGDELVGHKTYVIASDGDLMEGISHEAIGLAGNHKLSNLIVLWDNNNITIDGALSLSSCTDQLERFKSEGWIVDSCDGHDAA